MPPQLLKALAELSEAAKPLQTEWNSLAPEEQDRLAEGYPFEHSFDEVSHEIGRWADTHCKTFAVEGSGPQPGLAR